VIQQIFSNLSLFAKRAVAFHELPQCFYPDNIIFDKYLGCSFLSIMSQKYKKNNFVFLLNTKNCRKSRGTIPMHLQQFSLFVFLFYQ